MRYKSFVIVFLFLLSCSSRFVLNQPIEIPNPSDEVQTNLIKEGIALHDEGKYDLEFKNITKH